MVEQVLVSSSGFGCQAKGESLRHRTRVSAQFQKYSWLKLLAELHPQVDEGLSHRPLVPMGPHGFGGMGKRGA